MWRRRLTPALPTAAGPASPAAAHLSPSGARDSLGVASRSLAPELQGRELPHQAPSASSPELLAGAATSSTRSTPSLSSPFSLSYLFLSLTSLWFHVVSAATRAPSPTPTTNRRWIRPEWTRRDQIRPSPCPRDLPAIAAPSPACAVTAVSAFRFVRARGGRAPLVWALRGPMRPKAQLPAQSPGLLFPPPWAKAHWVRTPLCTVGPVRFGPPLFFFRSAICLFFQRRAFCRKTLVDHAYNNS